MTIKEIYIKYFKECNLKKYKRIGVYGSGYNGKIAIEVLKEFGIEEFYMIDRNRNIVDGQNVYILQDIEDEIDCIVVASLKYHSAIEVRIEKRCKKKKIVILSPFKMQKYYSQEDFVVNKYLDSKKEFLSEEKLIENLKQQKDYFESVKAYVEEAIVELPLFKLVEIETYNRCNGVCEFCPVNKNKDTRKEHLMEESLFYKIVSELENLGYDGRVSLFSNNEPLLDDRIFDFSKYLRKHVPMAQIHMYTNGTLFTIEKFKKLISELDELIIDNYAQNLKLIKPVNEIKEYCIAHPELKSKVTIVLRKPKELLLSRGGEAPNRKKKEIYNGVTCSMPFQQMVIRPTGDISLCCNDPLGKITLGNLNEQTLLEVWYGKKYEKIRNMIVKGRENIDHCKYCDVFTLYL